MTIDEYLRTVGDTGRRSHSNLKILAGFSLVAGALTLAALYPADMTGKSPPSPHIVPYTVPYAEKPAPSPAQEIFLPPSQYGWHVIEAIDNPSPTPAPNPTPPPTASIKGPETAKEGEFLWFDASASTGGEIQWDTSPHTLSMTSPDGKILVCRGLTTPMDVVVVVGNAQTGKFAQALQRVNAVTPPPAPVPPAPVPPSPPPAPPAPTATHLWMVVISNRAAPTLETATVLNDGAFWSSVQAAGHTRHFYDVDDPQAVVFKNIMANAGGPPTLVIMDGGSTPPGKVLKALRLPPTTTAIQQIINSLTGK
jgi:hypothetical protein